MNRYLNIKYAAIMRAFLLLMAVGLTGIAFAAKPDVAMQAELDAAVAAQATVDTSQNTTISAQGALINALQSDIANLKALIEKYHPTSPPKKIGDFYGGGVVFYVDASGQHGLIAALADQSDGIQWYNGVYKETGATGRSVGTGQTNTTLIIAAQIGDNPGGNFAAKVAKEYSVQEDGKSPCTGAAGETCHNDWYLPSFQELDLLYAFRHSPGYTDILLSNEFYWSSSEFGGEGGAEWAYSQDFYAGDIIFEFTKNNMFRVRAIRAF